MAALCALSPTDLSVERTHELAKEKGPSQRQLRVGELVRHALTEVLTRETLPDKALQGKIISITEVRMSPDLKIATCFVTLTGTKADKQAVAAIVKALAVNLKFLRGRAAPLLNQMRYMPTFRFRPDESFENFARIDAILRSDTVRRDLETVSMPDNDIRKDASEDT